VLVGGLVVLEFASLPLPLVPIETGELVPAVYRWLAQQAADSAAVELPACDVADAFRYEYFSTYHWHPLVNGHSGFEPDAYDDILQRVDEFPSGDSIGLLRGIGVRFAIVHADRIPASRMRALADEAQRRRDITLVQRFDDDLVYRIESNGSPHPPLEVGVQVPRAVRSDDPFTVLVSITNRGDTSRLFAPPVRAQFSAHWSDSSSDEHSPFWMPIVVPPRDTVQVPVSLRPPPVPGAYQVVVGVDTPDAVQQTSGAVQVAETLQDTRSPSGHHADIEGCKLASEVTVGSTYRIACDVRNDGRSVWLAHQSDERGSVGLGVRSWQDRGGHTVRGPEAGPLSVWGMLPWPLWPGQRARLTVVGEAPSLPGTYTVRVDVVSEHVTWFADSGASDPRDVRVEVRPR
jgi:hypothetical protein